MTGVPSYSTTASENVNANTGINWDEGMPPASVNNSARQNMADMRSQWNDAAWFLYGTGSKTTVIPVYVSATSFKIVGVNVTTYWHVGRRVKAVGAGTGTIYGTITASVFGTDTTITVTWDSGSLSNEALTIYASTTPITGNPVGFVTGPWTPADASGGGLTLTVAANSAKYIKIGKFVFAVANITYPATADGNTALISGLPFTADTTVNATGTMTAPPSFLGTKPLVLASTQTFRFDATTGSVILSNANMSTINTVISLFYLAAS